MKKLIYIFSIIFFIVSAAYAGVDLPWECSFTTADGVSSDITEIYGASALSSVCGAFNRHIDVYSCGNKTEEVLSTSNYSGGAGGRGQRHYRFGVDKATGGTGVTFNSSQDHIWARQYMRFSSAMANVSNSICLGGHSADISCDCYGSDSIVSNPQGDIKILYAARTPSGTIHLHYYYNTMGVQITWGGSTQHFYPNVGSYDSNYGWDNVQGGSYGSNSWHCYEFEIKVETPDDNADNGEIRIWLDGTLIAEHTGLNIGPNKITGWKYWGNNAYVRSYSDVGFTQYNDYDDMKIVDENYTGFIQDSEGNNMIGTYGEMPSGDITPPVIDTDNTGPNAITKACTVDGCGEGQDGYQSNLYSHITDSENSVTAEFFASEQTADSVDWGNGITTTGPDVSDYFKGPLLQCWSCGTSTPYWVCAKDSSANANTSCYGPFYVTVAESGDPGDTTAPVISNSSPSASQSCSNGSTYSISAQCADAANSDPLTMKYSFESDFVYSEGISMTPSGTGASGETWSASPSGQYPCGETQHFYIKCSDNYNNISNATEISFDTFYLGITGGGSGTITAQ